MQHADSVPQEQSISLHSTPRTTTYSYTLPTQPLQKKHVTQATVSYLREDLRKTMLVTAAIITSQLLLYYFLKTQLITLPIGGY